MPVVIFVAVLGVCAYLILNEIAHFWADTNYPV
jgi:hypothetical protein